MNAIERYQEITDKRLAFDEIILRIRNGQIKVGKYAGLVEISKNPKIKGKEFFTDGRSDDNKTK